MKDDHTTRTATEAYDQMQKLQRLYNSVVKFEFQFELTPTTIALDNLNQAVGHYASYLRNSQPMPSMLPRKEIADAKAMEDVRRPPRFIDCL